MMDKAQFKENLKSQYWRLNHLYWIMDEQGRKVRFKMNAIQYCLYKLLWWLNVILKSRQHGITTFVALFFLDMCLFTPNLRAGIIAHKLTDAKRIFRDKIHFAYDNLPEMIRERVPLLKDEAQELLFANNSGIYVGATMHSATFQLLHVTEYGWTCQHDARRAAEIKAALETIHEGGIVIIESTAEGVGDDFQSLCTAAENKLKLRSPLTRMDFRFHFYAWFEKPSNQLFDAVEIPPGMVTYFEKIEMQTGKTIGPAYRAWYVKKKEVLKDKMYAQHPSTPEEAFFASREGSFYGSYMVAAMERGRICDLPWEKSAPVHTCWDLGDMHTAIWFFQLVEDWIYWIDFYYTNQGLDLADYAKVLQVKPYVYGQHFIGPDFVRSNAKKNGKVMMDYAAECGIHFEPVEPHLIAERHTASRFIIHKSKFDRTRCKQGIGFLTNYHKQKNDLASTEDLIVYREIPFKDANCHGADAFGHGAIAYRTLNIGGTVMGRRTSRVVQGASREDIGSDDTMRV